MGKDAFAYVGLCMATYLILSGFEFLFLDPLIDFVFAGFRGHLLVYLIFLLVINPLLTKKITAGYKGNKLNRYGNDL